ncbi:Histone ubiquitination protein [Gracilaria domingensis]|nr:Histone ubiquitination protein [Gracilaria domingensis]
MDKKRRAISEPHPTVPPSKHFRSDSTLAASPDSSPDDVHPDAIITFQRAQLAAKIMEQQRDLLWLREKVDELRKLVAVLDAAPRAALYHMCAVREDLTLTLARLGLTNELDPAHCPIAAVMLNAEVVTNESLGEMPAAIKKLTAQIILAIGQSSAASTTNLDDSEPSAELHRRLREVSDQLERYAERDKQSLVSSTTFRDEYDDLRAESSLQRRRIVALELKLKEKQAALSSTKVDDSKSGDDTNAYSRSDANNADDPNTSSSAPVVASDSKALEAANALSDKRLEELIQLQQENKRLISENEALRADVSKRDAGIVPIKTILNTGLYQTMEANLQQLYLKERSWQMEKEAQNEQQEEERKHAQEQLAEAKASAEKTIEDLRRQMDELRRIADAAKVEKDKVVMTYEARKMEAGAAAAVIKAAEKRTKVCEEMRDKLEKANKGLLNDVNSLRARVAEYEAKATENASGANLSIRNLTGFLLSSQTFQVDTHELLSKLRKDIEEERLRSAGFIQEVESLSTMFGELESENEKLVRLLTEKEQVLSKVMAERLRGRQLLATVKEENRVLSQGREVDNDKIKALTQAVAASKKAMQEASTASLRAQQEARELTSVLEKRRRIADDAILSSRTANAEKDEMKRERDVYAGRVEEIQASVSEDKFESNRLQEQLKDMEQRTKDLEEALERSKQNGRSGSTDTVRDEIIRELRKKLNCSIVTNKPKEVVLLRCGHLFSRQCTDNLIATRNRKCPICGETFGKDDVRSVFF